MRRWLAGLACWLVAAAALPAQNAQAAELRSRGEPSGVRAQWQSFAPAFRDGAYGFLDLELRNDGREQHQVFAEVHTQEWAEALIGTSRSVVLDPGQRRRLALPIPAGIAGDVELRLAVDDPDDEESVLGRPLDDPIQACAVLILSGVGRGLSSVDEGRVASGRDVLIHECRPDQVPADWSLLSGFDVVVVPPEGARLTAEVARTLVEYAAGGGAVVVLGDELLPASPLRDLAAKAAAQRSRTAGYGLGQVVAADPRGVEAAITDVLDQAAQFPGRNALVGIEPIPGMDAVPVKVFFVLVLCFAICVGPLNYWILRRRRRQTVLVVTVPLIGLLFTVGILLWGVFRDGFGIRGAARSFCVFDQVERRAATTGLRSLYAGVGPAELRLDPGTHLACVQAYNRSASFRRRMQSHALLLDVDRKTLDGALLPSRFVTSMETTSVAASRPRVRFERDGSAYRLLAGPELAPAEGSTVILRELDGDGGRGRYFSGTVQGGAVRLTRMSPASLRAFARDAAQRVAPRIAEDNRHVRQYRVQMRDGAGIRARIEALSQGLPLGSYLMWAERPPAWDSLGLEVEWLASHHLVLGLCGEEDFDG